MRRAEAKAARGESPPGVKGWLELNPASLRTLICAVSWQPLEPWDTAISGVDGCALCRGVLTASAGLTMDMQSGAKCEAGADAS